MHGHTDAFPHVTGMKVIDHRWCPADVIGIAMGDQQGIERSQAARPQGWREHALTDVDSAAERSTTGVDQDRLMRRRLQQHRFTLTDIEDG